MQHRMNLMEWLSLAILAFLWASSFFLIKVGLAELPPLTLTFFRVFIASLFLLILSLIAKMRIPTSFNAWRAFMIMGLLNNVIPFSLIAWGQTQIPSSLAAILNATTPAFTVVLAHFLLKKEPLTWMRSLGVFLGLLGVGVLVGVDVLNGLSIKNLAQLAALGGAFFYATAGIYGRQMNQFPAIVSATGMLICASITLFPVVLIVDNPWHRISLGTSLKTALAVTALASTTVLTYILYFRLLAKVGSSNLMLVTFLVPIGALALGVTFLGEQLVWSEFMGMTFVFMGLAAIDGRAFRFFNKGL